MRFPHVVVCGSVVILLPSEERSSVVGRVAQGSIRKARLLYFLGAYKAVKITVMANATPRMVTTSPRCGASSQSAACVPGPPTAAPTRVDAAARHVLGLLDAHMTAAWGLTARVRTGAGQGRTHACSAWSRAASPADTVRRVRTPPGTKYTDSRFR